MIIACPACATRYVVPDSAIGPEGRSVRCAKCKHSWYQDGPEFAERVADTDAMSSPPASTAMRAPEADAMPAAAAPAPVADEDADTPAAAPAPRREPAAVPPAWIDDDVAPNAAPIAAPDAAQRATGARPPVAVPVRAFDDHAPPVPVPSQPVATHVDADDEGASPFEHAPPFRPRRNRLRWLTWGAGLFAALAFAAVVAMATLGTPSWLPVEKPLFGPDPGLKVEFPQAEQERRRLPNGAVFFGARVVVTNETRETRRVPPLLIVLRDGRDRIVYSWQLVPPQRSLAPGEAMTINEAMTDVPASATTADIGWAPR